MEDRERGPEEPVLGPVGLARRRTPAVRRERLEVGGAGLEDQRVAAVRDEQVRPAVRGAPQQQVPGRVAEPDRVAGQRQARREQRAVPEPLGVRPLRAEAPATGAERLAVEVVDGVELDLPARAHRGRPAQLQPGAEAAHRRLARRGVAPAPAERVLRRHGRVGAPPERHEDRLRHREAARAGGADQRQEEPGLALAERQEDPGQDRSPARAGSRTGSAG